MSYWLISLPFLESADRTWTLLQNKVLYENNLASNYRFKLPNLKVGTLDSLLVLSDDLVKVNGAVEGVVNKIRRQLFDMQTAGTSSDREDVLVEGMPPDEFLERFSWDDAKYPPRRPLQETVKTITETVSKLEDDLKVSGIVLSLPGVGKKRFCRLPSVESLSMLHCLPAALGNVQHFLSLISDTGTIYRSA